MTQKEQNPKLSDKVYISGKLSSDNLQFINDYFSFSPSFKSAVALKAPTNTNISAQCLMPLVEYCAKSIKDYIIQNV